MRINQKFEFVEGPFETETGELICVQKHKYGEVSLCFKENMYIPFSRIKLHSGNSLKDAQEIIKDAYNLGNEICKRWNAAKQQEEDIKFLAERQFKASSISFGPGKRYTGMSSNSIVGIAYGIKKLENQTLPSDSSDMDSCENMWSILPEHRKCGDALKAMENARNCDYHGKEKYLKEKQQYDTNYKRR